MQNGHKKNWKAYLPGPPRSNAFADLRRRVEQRENKTSTESPRNLSSSPFPNPRNSGEHMLPPQTKTFRQYQMKPQPQRAVGDGQRPVVHSGPTPVSQFGVQRPAKRRALLPTPSVPRTPVVVAAASPCAKEVYEPLSPVSSLEEGEIRDDTPRSSPREVRDNSPISSLEQCAIRDVTPTPTSPVGSEIQYNSKPASPTAEPQLSDGSVISVTDSPARPSGQEADVDASKSNNSSTEIEDLVDCDKNNMFNPELQIVKILDRKTMYEADVLGIGVSNPEELLVLKECDMNAERKKTCCFERIWKDGKIQYILNRHDGSPPLTLEELVILQQRFEENLARREEEENERKRKSGEKVVTAEPPKNSELMLEAELRALHPTADFSAIGNNPLVLKRSLYEVFIKFLPKRPSYIAPKPIDVGAFNSPQPSCAVSPAPTIPYYNNSPNADFENESGALDPPAWTLESNESSEVGEECSPTIDEPMQEHDVESELHEKPPVKRGRFELDSVTSPQHDVQSERLSSPRSATEYCANSAYDKITYETGTPEPKSTQGSPRSATEYYGNSAYDKITYATGTQEPKSTQGSPGSATEYCTNSAYDKFTYATGTQEPKSTQGSPGSATEYCANSAYDTITYATGTQESPGSATEYYGNSAYDKITYATGTQESPGSATEYYGNSAYNKFTYETRTPERHVANSLQQNEHNSMYSASFPPSVLHNNNGIIRPPIRQTLPLLDMRSTRLNQFSSTDPFSYFPNFSVPSSNLSPPYMQSVMHPVVPVTTAPKMTWQNSPEPDEGSMRFFRFGENPLQRDVMIGPYPDYRISPTLEEEVEEAPKEQQSSFADFFALPPPPSNDSIEDIDLLAMPMEEFQPPIHDLDYMFPPITEDMVVHPRQYNGMRKI